MLSIAHYLLVAGVASKIFALGQARSFVETATTSNEIFLRNLRVALTVPLSYPFWLLTQSHGYEAKFAVLWLFSTLLNSLLWGVMVWWGYSSLVKRIKRNAV